MDKDEKNLEFEDAKDLTIQDALKKHKEIEAGITPEDSVLDKYIKQNPEKVAAQKYSGKLSDFNGIDTSSLDTFIQRQKEDLVDKGLLNSTEGPASSVSPQSSEVAVADFSESEVQEAPSSIEEGVAQQAAPSEAVTSDEEKAVPASLNLRSEQSRKDALDDEDTYGFYEEDRKASKKKVTAITSGILVSAIVLLGLGYGLNTWNNNSKTTVSSQTSSSNSGKRDYRAFEKTYNSFFIDKDQTELDNDKFSEIDDLENQLNALKGTSYYDDAKTDFDNLDQQVTAIKTINGLFNKDIIVDGALVKKVSVKKSANFDNLSDDVLKTGNAKLDKLIQKAIAEGKKQLKASKNKKTSSANKQGASGNGSAQATPAPSSPSSSAPSQGGGSSNPGSGSGSGSGSTPSAPAAKGNIRQAGITNYDPAILQRDRSRVPYNATVVQDVNNTAWIFGEGVLEKIIATAQQRGHFTGNNFILEPVNIINGHGYYNMYKADGTYLFSINAQTGYFFGNAKGRADKADY